MVVRMSSETVRCARIRRAPGALSKVTIAVSSDDSALHPNCSVHDSDVTCTQTGSWQGTLTNVLAILVAVTDHAADRFRQRVRGTLEPKLEIAARVARAREAGQVTAGERGTILIRDLDRPALVYVCRPESTTELVVVTLWEEGEDAAVPKRFTDALERDEDHRQGRCY
jgi:hypothetical protein